MDSAELVMVWLDLRTWMLEESSTEEQLFSLHFQLSNSVLCVLLGKLLSRSRGKFLLVFEVLGILKRKKILYLYIRSFSLFFEVFFMNITFLKNNLVNTIVFFI